MKKIFKTYDFTVDMILYRKDTVKLSMDDASREIGISKSTLSRLEKANTIDIETFGLCCKWMNRAVDIYFNTNK